jgi:osmoprotectant transport system ATP-binding protein
VFVTHDIDEAIKMGDRIAILREGGVLAQYDTPREILTNPADDFVARFVGADRALKRLGLSTLAEIELVQPNGTQPNGDTVPLGTTVRDALSLLLSNGGRPLTVLDVDSDRDGAADSSGARDGSGDRDGDGHGAGSGDLADRAHGSGQNARVAGLLTLETVSELLDERAQT